MELMEHVAAKEQRRGVAGMARVETLGSHLSELVVAGIVADASASDIEVSEPLERFGITRAAARGILRSRNLPIPFRLPSPRGEGNGAR
jgi:hypothetical protein